MRPLKLSLTGFIGIKAGLGLDTLTIDLEQIASDAQLVALIGPNGAGKSTVMDNLHPYRLMPSRAGGYSPGSFSYYDQINVEAKKELDWEHDGQRYRSTLLIKQTAKTKKSEAYLFVGDGIDWKPASIADGTISDGKADTYDRIVDAICGSPEMFFTSAFSAQGRRSLSSYANGEIKGLLSELLGLDPIRDLGVKAGDEAKARKAKLEARREMLTKIDQSQAYMQQAGEELTTCRTDLVNAQASREVARKAVTTAASAYTDLKSAANGNNEVEIRRAALNSRISAGHDRATRALIQAQGDTHASERDKQIAIGGIERDIAALRTSVSGAIAQMHKARETQARAAEVAAAVAAEPALNEAITAANAAVDVARANYQVAQNLAMRIAGENNVLAAIIREGKQLAEALGSLETRAGLIKTVPCSGMDIGGECKLLADAHAAEAGIDAASTATNAAREAYGKQNAEQAALKSQLAAMGDTEAALKTAVQSAHDAAAAWQVNHALVALAPTIEQAEQIIATAQENIQQWQASIEEKDMAAALAKAAHVSRIKEIDKRLEEAHTAIDAEVAAARTELDTLPPPADTTALAAAELALRAAERSLSETDQTVSGLNARIGALQERVTSLARELKGADEAKASAAALEDDIAQWTLLSRALGNDGIIALSIDDAGPTLAAYANDLLQSCYGPRFSVSIQTQAETAKGDLKETFDIRVFDGDTGDDKSVRDMSGGQKIYINEALTRAIALYQAEMHGRHYECLFADESDGALDPERKIQFMRMKRKVLELGGYRQEIFISHTPELWGMADAIINLEDFRA